MLLFSGIGAGASVARADRHAPANQGLGVFVTSWAWEVGDASWWSTYVVRVTNRGDRDFSGEVVLSPSPSAAVGAVHRVPFDLAAGSQRNVAVPLLVTGDRYTADVLDRSGRPVSRGEPLAAPPGGDEWVGLLTDVPTGRAFLPATSRPPFRVSERFASALDFPDSAAMLTGLKAVVIVDFDSASLSKPQVAALEDFVALGGSLVLGGGLSAERTVLPLPAALTPLRPNATRPASLAPLADLAGQPDGGPAVVATGDIAGGQSVLESVVERVPLVIEQVLGAGRIVQLAYDPLEELGRSKALGAIARDHALARAGVGSPEPAEPPDSPEPTTFGSSVDPSLEALRSLSGGGGAAAGRPLGAGMVLAVYALLIGPVGYGLLKARHRPAMLWPLAAVAASVAAASAWAVLAAPWGDAHAYREVQVETMSPDGPASVDTYRLLRSRRPAPAKVVFAAGSLGAPVPRAGQPRRLPGVLSAVGLTRSEGAIMAPGENGGEVEHGSRTRITFGLLPKWETRLLRISTPSDRAPTRQGGDTAGGLGPPRLVCRCGPTAETRVYELQPPAGIPVRVTVVAPAGASESAPVVEAFNWSSGSWRVLSGDADAPLTLSPDELRDGQARVRASGPIAVSMVNE